MIKYNVRQGKSFVAKIATGSWIGASNISMSIYGALAKGIKWK